MTCPNCGKEVAKESAFCTNCGNKIKIQETEQEQIWSVISSFLGSACVVFLIYFIIFSINNNIPTYIILSVSFSCIVLSVVLFALSYICKNIQKLLKFLKI